MGHHVGQVRAGPHGAGETLHTQRRLPNQGRLAHSEVGALLHIFFLDHDTKRTGSCLKKSIVPVSANSEDVRDRNNIVGMGFAWKVIFLNGGRT